METQACQHEAVQVTWHNLVLMRGWSRRPGAALPRGTPQLLAEREKETNRDRERERVRAKRALDPGMNDRMAAQSEDLRLVFGRRFKSRISETQSTVAGIRLQPVLLS